LSRVKGMSGSPWVRESEVAEELMAGIDNLILQQVKMGVMKL